MKLFIIFLIIAVSTAKKRKKLSLSQRNNNATLLDNNNHIDLSGTFRKEFFVHAAASNPTESTVCSPISALIPLGKLALGAEGQCLEELLSAIGVFRKTTISNHFKPLILELRYLPGVKLDIASKLYVSVNSRLERSFTEQSKDIFESSAEKIDFQYPTYVAEYINAWVSSQTHGLIKEMISPPDIPPSTSLILVNGVYFSGKWKEKFESLKNATFHLKNSHKTIEMMTTVGYYNYSNSEALGSRLVQIPYTGEKASFLLILPTSRTGLSVLLSQLKLAPELLESALSRMEKTKLRLTIPKFKIESEFNLNTLYAKIGVKRIFNKVDSGLNKIIRDEALHLTNGKHKAFIDVNEFGTEAAGSSALNMMKLTHKSPLDFKADHPFLFLILVKGQQLFSGTFVNPK